jgi:hypothetical protein
VSGPRRAGKHIIGNGANRVGRKNAKQGHGIGGYGGYQPQGMQVNGKAAPGFAGQGQMYGSRRPQNRQNPQRYHHFHPAAAGGRKVGNPRFGLPQRKGIR